MAKRTQRYFPCGETTIFFLYTYAESGLIFFSPTANGGAASRTYTPARGVLSGIEK